MKIMSVLITVILYGRMIEIYLYCSVSPIPFATMTNREWGQIGNNYLKSLFAIGFHRESTALNDTDMKYLLLYLEETYGLTNEKKIDNAIGIVANENKYHPIRDYLNTLVWDGTERIRFCLRHFLGADADDYTYEALKLFLMGAISRAFQPGCKFEIMLCLVGGQGAGKSTFFRLLAVRDEWFSDDLRKLDDDNVYRKLQCHWINTI